MTQYETIKKPAKRVLETRATPEGMVRRRYERDGLPRLTTYEIPASVIRAIGKKKVVERMEIWLRGEEIRRRTERIDRLVADGVKPTAVANEVGVTEQAVRFRRKRANDVIETPPPCPKPH